MAVLILEARDRGNVTGLEGNAHKHKMRRERREESASPSQYLPSLAPLRNQGGVSRCSRVALLATRRDKLGHRTPRFGFSGSQQSWTAPRPSCNLWRGVLNWCINVDRDICQLIGSPGLLSCSVGARTEPYYSQRGEMSIIRAKQGTARAC